MDLTESTKESSHRHFWELARADAVLAEAGPLQNKKCLDFGAGDLYFAERTHLLSQTK